LAQRVEKTATAIGDAAETAGGAVSSIASPEVTENIRRITGALAALTEEVQHGEGLAHALIYDRAPARRVSAILSNLEDATKDASTVSKRLDRVVGALEQGPGTLHTLLYGDEGAALLADLAELGERLNRISAQVEAGQGTIGGLLVDPSVYEDMKTVLGNVERNVIFKALARMTIKNGDIERPAKLAKPLNTPRTRVQQEARPP
jgi:phospholipid/cholesterol/gamma-HCH transport system substrate-binding protein